MLPPAPSAVPITTVSGNGELKVLPACTAAVVFSPVTPTTHLGSRVPDATTPRSAPACADGLRPPW